MQAIVAKWLGDYGVVPGLLLLCVIIWFFLREIKKEVSSVKSNITAMKDDLLKRIHELEKRSDKKDEELLKELKRMEEEIQIIHKEYLRKDEHYRDLGGWRAEFRDLQERIDDMYKVIIKGEC